MYRKFLNARSPLRLLEKGLHGGLGPGNLGIVIGGPGVGKASFLVGVALDELLRSGRVLHVSMAHPVSHIRDHYDTVFEDLAASAHLEDEARVHVDIDRNRSIRVYPKNELTPAKLRRVARAADSLLRARGLTDAPRTLLGAAVELDADGSPRTVRFIPVEEVR